MNDVMFVVEVMRGQLVHANRRFDCCNKLYNQD